jgi:hypothetical protein
MSFWKKLFGGGDGPALGPVKSLDYKGYLIEAVPFADGGQFQLAGLISKTIDGERKVHRFIRADKFQSRDDAADIAISKGQLIIDQSGDRLFE